MGKKKKLKDEWSYDKTPETEEAIKRLHETIRMRKLKDQDDKLNYDTGGKLQTNQLQLKNTKRLVKSSGQSIGMWLKNLEKTPRLKIS